MPRYAVKDAGIYAPKRYRVIDTGKAGAEVLHTSSRKIAEGLAADYNSRYAPSLLIRVARWFDFCLPAPSVAPTEEPWQRKIRELNERIERRKNRPA